MEAKILRSENFFSEYSSNPGDCLLASVSAGELKAMDTSIWIYPTYGMFPDLTGSNK
jgi:hypothetical protein